MSQKQIMQSLLEGEMETLSVGDLVEGEVLNIEKNAIYVDLSPFGTGIVFGREFLPIKDIIKNINVGDLISAKIVELEGEEGYIELSLKEARKAGTWREAELAQKEGRILSLPVKEANRGGLIISWQGIIGFLPASHLSQENYPKVSGGDKNRIFLELQKLVGQKLDVKIITVDLKENRLIFSEKTDGSGEEKREKGSLTEKYSVGDELEGEVTGIVDFGIFVKIEGDLEGLVHISEISWSLVENPEKLYKVGDTVKVTIIDVTPEKISLSIKALSGNPWDSIKEKYKKGDVVEAVVIKYNDYGALVSVQEGVAGLVHVSSFENFEGLKEKLELGKNYSFKINVFDALKQKMTLSLIN